MKFLEEVERTGRIPEFRAEDLLEELIHYDAQKPSSRIIRTRKGRKALAVLQEIQDHHNHSWYQEVKDRSLRNPDALAIFYRGEKISFRQMFEKVDLMANAMASLGLKKGDEVPCCLSNTPELIYTMLAANKIGLKLNLFGTHLDKNYLKSILDGTSHKLLIATDDVYGEIKDVAELCDFNHKLIFSLADSLPKDPKKTDEYVSDLDKYYHYDNLALEYQHGDDSIITLPDFLSLGKNYTGKVVDDNDLNTEFLITYTSGSTKRGFPKQLIHSNRSLIVSGTFNDMELSGSPKIPYQRGMCYIHTESNTNLVTCISDNLMKLWSVACEPEYDRRTALDVIRINRPSMIEMTTSHLIQFAKDYLKATKSGTKYKFPHLIATFAVGEPTSKGEEKLINTVLRQSRAGSGVKVKGINLPYAPLSVGGGDCEHGGIFYNVFNSVQAKVNFLKTRSMDSGMAPVVFGVITALKKDKNGDYVECNYDEYGVLVANTATNMVGYKDELEKTKSKIIRDNIGRDWLSCDVYGYIDRAGNVHQKDRINSEIRLENGNVILPSQIADVVLADTKNVLSCTVTKYNDGIKDVPIINFELSPLRIDGREKAISSIVERINSRLGMKIGKEYYLREIPEDTSYSLAGSGKRDIVALEDMGLNRTVKISIPVEDIQKPKIYRK